VKDRQTARQDCTTLASLHPRRIPSEEFPRADGIDGSMQEWVRFSSQVHRQVQADSDLGGAPAEESTLGSKSGDFFSVRWCQHRG